MEEFIFGIGIIVVVGIAICAVGFLLAGIFGGFLYVVGG